MSETRTRPAREAERFRQIYRANLWFWKRMSEADDPCYDVMSEWQALTPSVQIRRWRAAQPQESSDLSDEDRDRYDANDGE